MLRLFVLILLLLNGTYLAWSQGLLVGLGWAPAAQTEPQRLGQQIKSEAVRLLSAQELALIELAVQPAPKPNE
jgi:hypothetical protein